MKNTGSAHLTPAPAKISGGSLERIQMELTETEKAIILQYRKLTWLQPSIKKLLDVVEPEERPRIINIRKHIPTANGAEQ